MKNLLLIFAFSACGFMANAINWKDKGAVPTPAKYESFEEGVPATWILQGKGKLSIDPWHYKLGKKSLQWDFKAGDIIKINNTIGEPNRRGGLNNREYASFGIWVYSPKAMKDKKLSFEFYSGDKKTAYFDFYLNYTGWQFGTVAYGLGRILKGKVSRDTDNIRIKAPAADGRVSIDLVVYNGPVYDSCVNILPSRTPWHARRLDEKKYPVPISVSHADKDAIANLEAALTPKISNQKTINKLYGHVTESIAMLNIIEDEHGIRGIPINTPRSHAGVRYTGSIYFYNGINQDKISGYKETMLYGTKKPCRILSYASTIACSLDKEKRKLLAQKIAAVWRYLIDQGVNSSSGTTGFYYAGTYIVLAKLLFVFADELEQAGLLETLFNYAQFKVYELFSDRPSVGYGNMDYFYAFKNYYYLAFAYSTDVCKRLQVLHYLKDRLDKDITSDLGGVGFKVDGSGFHDEAEHKNDYFGNALRELSTLVRLISHSSFAISPEAFNILKKCALNRCFYSNNLEFPIFMQGTGPMEKDKYSKYIDSYFPNAVLKNLALAAPGGCDKELAQAYVNLKDVMRNNKLVSGKSPYDNIFEKKYNLKPLGPPQGTISMPYTKLVAHRRDKWLAVAWGGKIDMRQRGNHYMYHGRNAPLSILGPEGFFGSGNQEAGWDWNRINGTTCLYMPDLTDKRFIYRPQPPEGKKYLQHKMQKLYFYRATSKDPQIKGADGGMSWRGANGTFKREFWGDAFYNDFGGLKSYFFINDRIYALGSNIKSDNKKYHVQTNLYQKVLRKKDDPTYVDGKEIKTFPVDDQALDSKKPHYLVDPVGNGYYVPSGQKVFTARKHQKSRTTKYFKSVDHEGDFATAWLEHGVGCQDGRYVYVVMPYCDREKLAKFSDKDFEILQQDDFAHILHDKIDGFYAGIFFKGGKVSKLPHVAEVERSCQIMYQKKDGKLVIAVGDPDPHRYRSDKLMGGGASRLTPLKVTFDKKWRLAEPVDGVKILNSGKDKTIIEFTCIHGKSFDFILTE